MKGNIGSSEITYKALQSGQIDMYPEYTGTLLTAVAGDTAPPHSAQQAYTEAKAFAEKHGLHAARPRRRSTTPMRSGCSSRTRRRTA